MLRPFTSRYLGIRINLSKFLGGELVGASAIFALKPCVVAATGDPDVSVRSTIRAFEAGFDGWA